MREQTINALTSSRVPVAMIEDEIASAVARTKEACAKLIEQQNDMVNELFEPKGRHDAFVRDIVAAIRRL